MNSQKTSSKISPLTLEIPAFSGKSKNQTSLKRPPTTDYSSVSLVPKTSGANLTQVKSQQNKIKETPAVPRKGVVPGEAPAPKKVTKKVVKKSEIVETPVNYNAVPSYSFSNPETNVKAAPKVTKPKAQASTKPAEKVKKTEKETPLPKEKKSSSRVDDILTDEERSEDENEDEIMEEMGDFVDFGDEEVSDDEELSDEEELGKKVKAHLDDYRSVIELMRRRKF